MLDGLLEYMSTGACTETSSVPVRVPKGTMRTCDAPHIAMQAHKFVHLIMH